MKLILLLLVTSSLLTANDKMPTGEVRNPQAFAKIRSFCVDTGGLSNFDRGIVKDFVKAESKPKHLLTKLPWRLVPECQGRAPDAAAKVEFVPLRVTRVVLPQGAPGRIPETPYAVKVALQVVDAGSQEPLYSVEARAVINAVGPEDSPPRSPTSENTNPLLEKRDALYHAFWYLVDDVRQLKPTQTE